MKHLWLILFVVFIGCYTSLGRPTPDFESNTYFGEYDSSGRRHGKGTLIWNNGKKWEGEWIKGIPFNGYGFIDLVGSNVGIFEGKIVTGWPDGIGILTRPNGITFSGEWNALTKGKWNGKFVIAKPGTKEKQIRIFNDSKAIGISYGILGSPNDEGVLIIGELKYYSGDNNNLVVMIYHNGNILQAGIRNEDNNNFIENWDPLKAFSYLKKKYPNFKGFDEFNPSIISNEKNTETSMLATTKAIRNIAVIDLIGNNISDSDVKALSDRLRIELFNTKHFNVVERGMMEEILAEQGLQQSGCTTNECIVEVGQLIGVNQIVGGSISRVGNTYSITARIVNVETGNIFHTTTYDYKGEIDELLISGMKKVAIDLTK
tara:strand:- start:621 stop:1742 length:1122 start_codon:yes stop_codon:yes gene_type:complete